MVPNDSYTKQHDMYYTVYEIVHSAHFIYGYIDIGHMVKNHTDGETGNPLSPLHGLLFPIDSKASFIGTIP